MTLAGAAEAIPARAGRVVFVLPTSGAFDARTRRMAATLATRGHSVEVLARLEPGLAAEEELPGGARLRRSSAAVPRIIQLIPQAGLRRIATVAATALARQDPMAGSEQVAIVHAMGVLALPRAFSVARTAGAAVVYDARDLYPEARNLARLPRPVRWLAGRIERRWARRAAAVATVNDQLADRLAAAWGIPRPAVIHNCPPRWSPNAERPDRLRTTLGLAAGSPIALYHGGFSRDRGLEQLAAALREPGLEAVHAVYLGYGRLADALADRADDPAVGGRLHVLPAVPPEELLDWISTADVAVMAIQPTTLNHRLTTPNKLFEAIAAGVPVVASDFPGIRDVVDGEAGPLGVLVDPTKPAQIAAGIAAVLGMPPVERAALGARCLAAAHDRWNWETEVVGLLALYERLTARAW